MTKPVVLSPATNDALGASLKNIGFLDEYKKFLFCSVWAG